MMCTASGTSVGYQPRGLLAYPRGEADNGTSFG